MVIELYIDSEPKPIGVTPLHPIWSADRRTWVAAGALRIGERVQTRSGYARVVEIRKRPVIDPVYNIEVEGDHVYRVGQGGVLVHNASAQERRDHTSTLDTRPAPSNSSASAVFQRNECGTTEYRVEGGGERAWADTIVDCDIVDCKAIRTPTSSPVLGTAPEFIEQAFRAQELALFRRYESVINDPCTPYDRLVIRIDREAARAYWQALLDDLSITTEIELRSQSTSE